MAHQFEANTEGAVLQESQEIERKGTSTTKKFWLRPSEDIEPEGLLPDHDLMKRFQIALKNHLHRQNERLSEEVLELDGDIRKKNKEHIDLEETLRTMQQEVTKQKDQLLNYHESLSQTKKMRDDMEQKVQNSKSHHLVDSDKLRKQQKKEEELSADLRKILLVKKQFVDWEAEMESELAVSQRISEKMKLDKKQLAEEKKKQDLFLLKLTNEVANLETQITTLEGQLKVKEEERLIISQTLADANVDLEALNKEQQRLLQAWNGVVISMQQRDKAYAAVMDEKKNLHEKFLTLNQEIESYKKSANDEMLKNEKLTGMLQKLQMDLANVEKQISVNNDKRILIETQLSSNMAMLEETEKSLETAVNEGKKHSNEISALHRELEKLLTERTQLEDKILEVMQEQVTQDKSAKYLNASLRQLHEKTRSQELALMETENQLTQAELEVEQQNSELLHGVQLLEEANHELQQEEDECQHAANSLTQFKSSISKRQATVDLLNKQLEELVAKTGGQEVTPYQLKMMSLQTAIDETEQKSEHLQQVWIRQQNRVVSLSKKRNEQQHQLNILQKQVSILDQKNMTIEEEMDDYNKKERDVCHCIRDLLNKLDKLNEKLCEHKEYKEALDKHNIITQTDYLNSLKDAETYSLQLEAEISDLVKEKADLAEMLLDNQRENLAWEKKVQMALETKHNIRMEKGTEGEIGAMKNEIHRMQVRYTQLCHAQEKLVQDLEHCVTRREAIVNGAIAKEKRSTRAIHNTKVSFQKKLDDLRSKIKQKDSETRHAERTVIERKKRHEDVLQRLTEKQAQLKQLEEVTQQIDKQLQDGQLQKHQNLELLVRRQRKAKMFGDVKAGKHRLLYRTEHALDAETQRQKSINTDLISVVESLLSDFPALHYDLTKVLNTLRLQS
ncbi:coiled-coil domain-containing protein 40 [Schistocerca nitens]|uniref:coiled-coil domain-containing protein 40 n=1 Tax=Schistocerca nitens TaxID=7011 RepID=UPI0021178D69|nr:coiled-coil domain-containing protein 40 [Schistocerca nitens]